MCRGGDGGDAKTNYQQIIKLTEQVTLTKKIQKEDTDTEYEKLL